MNTRKIVVTGGAGYVGSVLIPKLLAQGHQVKVIDLYLYGQDVLDSVKDNPRLAQVKGDIRNRQLLEKEISGYDTIIHLACISNDPSFELNPQLGKSINYDAFLNLVEVAQNQRIDRFIYASSSSVYGIKSQMQVTEDLPLEPLTDYSKYKALCEKVLQQQSPEFTWCVLRPATVCGYSPRLRLDLTVNILTNLAINTGKITVFGGSQTRPNIHIQDMTDLYVKMMDFPHEMIHHQIFNAGYENHTVAELAEKVRNVVTESTSKPVEIITTPSNDQRSYRVSSAKIKQYLDFTPKYSIEQAIAGLIEAFQADKIPDSLNNIKYYNIKTMQAINLQ